jgi:hypothetical protein
MHRDHLGVFGLAGEGGLRRHQSGREQSGDA